MVYIDPNEIISWNSNDGRWEKATPFKILSFMWREKQGKIPSGMALSKRGVPISSKRCNICNLDEETSDHILIMCSMAEIVIDSILTWCEI